ncbi:MAG: M48 family metalloprotease [Phaeodactylibacter sp.]|nr:M48 family metalloprotease [Phaeodactylibacter sp.]
MYGHWRPCILAPAGLLAGLTPGEVEALLLHELAHIKRHGYLVNLLQRAVETLLFYHPAIWWLSAKAGQLRE